MGLIYDAAGKFLMLEQYNPNYENRLATPVANPAKM